MGQSFVLVGQALVWVGHGLPGLIARTACGNIPASFLFWHIRSVTCENMTSSTIPEVHNCHQRTTKPRPQLACRANLVKFGRVVFKTCEWTQTDIHTDMLFAILSKCGVVRQLTSVNGVFECAVFPLIEAGSLIQAGSLVEAGGSKGKYTARLVGLPGISLCSNKYKTKNLGVLNDR